MRVSVVILSYNRRPQLTTVLERLREVRFPGGEAPQVIVVDNASTDGTPETLDSAGVEAVKLPANRGIPSWNEGAVHATGDWLLLLDDDCYPAPDAIEHALAAAERTSAAMVSFQVRDPARPSFVFNACYPTGLLSFWGCSVLVSRAVFEQLGGFERGIFCWAHEVDFTLRFLDARYTHAYEPKAVSYHMTRPGYSDRKFVMNQRNLAYIVGRLFPAGLRSLALLGALMPVLDGLGQRPLAPIYRQVLRGVLSGYRDGRRCAAPVRSAVARLYVRYFHDLSPGMALLPVRRRLDPRRKRLFPLPGQEGVLRVE
jgi:GT2 family glycosyltransferase